MQSYWSGKSVRVNFGDVCKYISIVGCEKIILGKGRVEPIGGDGVGVALLHCRPFRRKRNLLIEK